ncbi:MAG: pilus assembly protein N-terminal domain-containing protein [Planctomycetaceae bacterium]|nr:pilus assembly protein N-terminal domain-containing protein [Planctomycetaceae bacterium]
MVGKAKTRTHLIVVIVGALAVQWALGQENAPVKPPQAAPEKIYSVDLGKSLVVKAPWPVKRVAVTDDKIAGVQVLSPDQVLLQGKKVGSTDVILWRDDEVFEKARVDVVLDLNDIREQFKTLFPGAVLNITQSAGAVTIDGRVTRAEEAVQIRRYFDARGVKHVDMTRLAGVQQVMLHVRVAEVSRTAVRALGLNVFDGGDDFFGGMQIGPDQGGALVPMAVGPAKGVNAANNIPFTFNADVFPSPNVTLFGGFPDWNFQFFLQALAENQYLRILAEPTLVALSGEEANFLAGGEYPIPVVQGTSTGGGTSITIEYRQFGVRLRFRPTVLGDNSIRLFVAPEVSELSDAGAVEMQGFRIPSLRTRRAETTLQLRSNQTFAMAGLISRAITARNARIPFVGDVPVLGALARSVRHTSGETELMVLVTASLVEPLDVTPPLPGDTHTVVNDWELYCLGKLEGTAKVPPKAADEEIQWLKRQGLNRLVGPGAWQRHGQQSPASRAEFCPPAAPASATQPAR